MKLGPVTTLDKRNKKISKKKKKKKKLAMPENYDIIVILSIFDQFRAIRKPDSARIACKTYVFINNNLLSYKN